MGAPLHGSRSSNAFKPLGHLDLGCALIGPAGVVEFLLGDEVVHVPVRQGNLVLILFAEQLFLGEGGW